MAHVNQVLEQHGGHVLSAAAALGVSGKTLRDWAKQFPKLGPLRDYRGTPARRKEPRKKPSGALVAITESEDQVFIEVLLLRGHRGAIALVNDELRRCFGAARVKCTSGATITVARADGCAVRAPISDALDSAGLRHHWLLGARRSRAVPA